MDLHVVGDIFKVHNDRQRMEMKIIESLCHQIPYHLSCNVVHQVSSCACKFTNPAICLHVHNSLRGNIEFVCKYASLAICWGHWQSVCMWNKLGGASFRFLRLQISVGRFVGGGDRGIYGNGGTWWTWDGEEQSFFRFFLFGGDQWMMLCCVVCLKCAWSMQ